MAPVPNKTLELESDVDNSPATLADRRLSEISQQLHDKSDAFAQLKQITLEKSRQHEEQVAGLNAALSRTTAQLSDKEESLQKLLRRDAQRSKMMALLKSRVEELAAQYRALAGDSTGNALMQAQLVQVTAEPVLEELPGSAVAEPPHSSTRSAAQPESTRATNNTVRSASQKFNLLPEEEVTGGALAPMWKPDISAPVCFTASCRVSFSLIKRKVCCYQCCA
jgi:hypothetical protein